MRQTHGLNVQLQEGREAVVEQLDLAFAEHADEVGRPELAGARKLVDELPRAGLGDQRKRRRDGVSPLIGTHKMPPAGARHAQPARGTLVHGALRCC